MWSKSNIVFHSNVFVERSSAAWTVTPYGIRVYQKYHWKIHSSICRNAVRYFSPTCSHILRNISSHLIFVLRRATNQQRAILPAFFRDHSGLYQGPFVAWLLVTCCKICHSLWSPQQDKSILLALQRCSSSVFPSTTACWIFHEKIGVEQRNALNCLHYTMTSDIAEERLNTYNSLAWMWNKYKPWRMAEVQLAAACRKATGYLPQVIKMTFDGMTRVDAYLYCRRTREKRRQITASRHWSM